MTPSEQSNSLEEVSTAARDRLVADFAASVKRLRAADDAVIAEPSMENVVSLIEAVDDYSILRQEVRRVVAMAYATARCSS